MTEQKKDQQLGAIIAVSTTAIVFILMSFLWLYWYCSWKWENYLDNRARRTLEPKIREQEEEVEEEMYIEEYTPKRRTTAPRKKIN